jgi:hypothetical protein
VCDAARTMRRDDQRREMVGHRRMMRRCEPGGGVSGDFPVRGRKLGFPMENLHRVDGF